MPILNIGHGGYKERSRCKIFRQTQVSPPNDEKNFCPNQMVKSQNHG